MELSLTQILWALALCALAGLSTIAGAVIAFFSRKDNSKVLSLGLSFSAGVMIYISFMEILPVAFKDFNTAFSGLWGEILAIVCFFIGVLLSALVDKLIPENLSKDTEIELQELKICPLFSKENLAHLKEKVAFKDENTARNLNSLSSNSFNSNSLKTPNQSKDLKALRRTGVLTAIAVALHNFPEGFATFVSALENLNFGILIALAIAIHNIPEGMAVSLPIYHSTGDKKKAFIYSALSGLTEPLGALVGIFLLLPFLNELILAVSFALVAGIMIYISFDELLPAARIYGEPHHCLYGLLVGMGVMAFSLALLNNV